MPGSKSRYRFGKIPLLPQIYTSLTQFPRLRTLLRRATIDLYTLADSGHSLNVRLSIERVVRRLLCSGLLQTPLTIIAGSCVMPLQIGSVSTTNIMFKSSVAPLKRLKLTYGVAPIQFEVAELPNNGIP